MRSNMREPDRLTLEPSLSRSPNCRSCGGFARMHSQTRKIKLAPLNKQTAVRLNEQNRTSKEFRRA